MRNHTHNHNTSDNHEFGGRAFGGRSFEGRAFGGGRENFGGGFGPGAGGFGPGGPGFGGPGFGGFGPGFGPRGQRRAGKGDVRSVILSLLESGPSNGYGLIKAIAERTGGTWRPSPGSVYPTLQQLVDEELIVSKGDGRRTEFELTDAGRAYLEEHADELKKAWEATPGRSASDAAFHESVAKLVGVVQQFRGGTSEAQRTAAAEKLDEARRALYLILAD
ncbi:PadR family transcriptional regulator [Subtercola boreus]|uniref:PadR family transcriptional regulator n=1 Tax=Subtercola boreus TaxID=120213 RepID=A0A3E0W7Z2_9MICO|nr:PadR family transcriptional regulator [Subtercola boreus]RFA19124.1 PadR family transcriptional regulator [Subtercola boreus]RFA19243.1 PadR family transcriptional regulator [Subtercola boreus]RFA25723.1 PadR family transcriptional regulator [Subtercola boreus]